MNEEDDLMEIAKVFLFALAVTWVPFAFFEIHQPFVEKKLRYERQCEEKGGFVYERQNEETRCIKKDYITIPL
jgi:hypothetical protein